MKWFCFAKKNKIKSISLVSHESDGDDEMKNFKTKRKGLFDVFWYGKNTNFLLNIFHQQPFENIYKMTSNLSDKNMSSVNPFLNTIYHNAHVQKIPQ